MRMSDIYEQSVALHKKKRGKLEITRGGNAKPRIDHAAKEKKLLEEK